MFHILHKYTHILRVTITAYALGISGTRSTENSFLAYRATTDFRRVVAELFLKNQRGCIPSMNERSAHLCVRTYGLRKLLRNYYGTTISWSAVR